MIQWMQDLVSQSQEYDNHKHDYLADTTDFSFDAITSAVQPPEGLFQAPPLYPTEQAWTQIFSKLGPAVYGKGSNRVLPNDYLLAIDPDVRAINLNRAIGKMVDKRWLVRGYDSNARAVLSEDYTILPNTDILLAVQEILEKESERFPRLQPVRPYVSADELSLKIVWADIKDDGNGGAYGIGAWLTNGETGFRRFRGLPLIQRGSCTNSTIVDNTKESFSFVHRGSFRSVIVQLKAMIGQLLRASAELVDKMILAEEEYIPDLADVVTGLAKIHGWDDRFTNNVLIGTEGKASRAGLVFGVSYAAHNALEDPLAQADAEILAGDLLVTEGSIFSKARAVALRD